MIRLGLIATALYYLKYGPEAPEEDSAGSTMDPVSANLEVDDA